MAALRRTVLYFTLHFRTNVRIRSAFGEYSTSVAAADKNRTRGRIRHYGFVDSLFVDPAAEITITLRY